MKRLLIILTLLISTTVFAQENNSKIDTLFRFEDSTEHGFFVGPAMKQTQFNEETATLAGFRGAWIIDHSFSIGAGFYGLASDLESGQKDEDGEDLFYQMGYLGIEMEYIHNYSSMVHFTTTLLVGGGSIGLETNCMRKGFHNECDCDDDDDDTDNDDDELMNKNGFSVIEPTLGVDINIGQHFVTSLGVGYRFVTGIKSNGLENEDVGGPTASLTLKFGIF